MVLGEVLAEERDGHEPVTDHNGRVRRVEDRLLQDDFVADGGPCLVCDVHEGRRSAVRVQHDRRRRRDARRGYAGRRDPSRCRDHRGGRGGDGRAVAETVLALQHASS